MKSKENKEAMNAYFVEAKHRAQEMKRSLVKSASFYDKEKISERLHRMILYAIGRQDWYDDRQHRLLNIGLALIASSVAIATFISATLEYLPLLSKIFGWLTVLCIFGTGLSLVYYYNRQLARDHPYRKVVDTRSWYFIYAFPTKLKDSLSRNFGQAKQQIEQTTDAYRVFMKRWLEYAPDQDRFIEEDLEQVFILQLLQRYRFQAVSIMSKMLYYGICLAAIFTIIAILGYVLN